MKILKLFILTSIIALAACTKPPIHPPKEGECNKKGKIETAMCGWGVYDAFWIRLDDGTFLQPCQSDIALIDKSKLYNGREVEIGYEKIDNARKKCVSKVTCLAYPGEHISVRITCLNLLGEDKPKEEAPKCKYENQGVLYDWTGKLSGCGWVIKMNDGTMLELHDYDPKATGLDSGTPVLFDYSALRRGSICMVGIPAKINCIKIANTTF